MNHPVPHKAKKRPMSIALSINDLQCLDRLSTRLKSNRSEIIRALVSLTQINPDLAQEALAHYWKQ